MGPGSREHATSDCSLRVIVRGRHCVDERGERVEGAGISVIDCTERVPGALGSEGCFVGAREKGPVTRCGIRDLHVLGIRSHYWRSVPIRISHNTTGSVIDDVYSRLQSMITRSIQARKMVTGFDLLGS